MDGNFWESTHKNLVETCAILIISLESLIEISVRDRQLDLFEILIQSSRDTHHHSASLYHTRSYESSRDICHHTHTYVDI